jgi:hypothetical protein
MAVLLPALAAAGDVQSVAQTRLQEAEKRYRRIEQESKSILTKVKLLHTQVCVVE